jgi:hypothetical protein
MKSISLVLSVMNAMPSTSELDSIELPAKKYAVGIFNSLAIIAGELKG